MEMAHLNRKRRVRTAPSAAVGLRDIAQQLDISPSLVSKVLNGRLGTSGATKGMIQAIHDKASELQYRKNVSAESLRSGRQNAIAVCIHRIGEPGSAIVDDMVTAITKEAMVHDQRLLLYYYGTIEEFRAFKHSIHRGTVDGVVVGGIDHPELIDDLSEMRRGGLPVVSIFADDEHAVFPNVWLDQTAIGQKATRHLIEQGCRRIAHFTAHKNGEPMAEPFGRFDGYRKALRKAGLPVAGELIVYTQRYGYHDGADATRKLLDSGVKFDGIFGQSDAHVAGALNLLLARGIHVPEQVKLIGVDNSPYCEYAAVALSSVSQEFGARGREAVQLLMKELSGQTVSSVRTEPIIHVRASSAITSVQETVP